MQEKLYEICGDGHCLFIWRECLKSTRLYLVGLSLPVFSISSPPNSHRYFCIWDCEHYKLCTAYNVLHQT